MTKDQFIAAVEAKPNFIKWTKAPAHEPNSNLNAGDIEHWHGLALIQRDDGWANFNVWFFVDKSNNEANWQNFDSVEPEANKGSVKEKALKNYLASNFVAYFLDRVDLDNNWASATVYTLSGQDLSESRVMVYKIRNNPITHKVIV